MLEVVFDRPAFNGFFERVLAISLERLERQSDAERLVFRGIDGVGHLGGRFRDFLTSAGMFGRDGEQHRHVVFIENVVIDDDRDSAQGYIASDTVIGRSATFILVLVIDNGNLELKRDAPFLALVFACH